jgi:hypothetical protein
MRVGHLKAGLGLPDAEALGQEVIALIGADHLLVGLKLGSLGRHREPSPGNEYWHCDADFGSQKNRLKEKLKFQ